MANARWAKQSLMAAVDAIMGAVPRNVPSRERLMNCRLVAHRGSHDSGATVCENTIAAFDRAVNAGAYGIEFDVRWTADDIPVIHHDETCQRVFKNPARIQTMAFKDLREALPRIPTLEEMVARYGRKAHLMIEIKRCELTSRKLASLRDLLGPLRAGEDYHLMSLRPEILGTIEKETWLPKHALLSISEVNVRSISEITLSAGWGGFTGHYFLVSDETIRKHQERGQKAGTGFADSRNVLFREINRGVDWVFSNRAPEMTEVIKAALAQP